MSTKLPLLTCLAATLFMTGLIWFVHVVHYPLFARVEVGSFREYHAEHTRATSLVVVLPMVLELLGAAWLVAHRPQGSDRWMVWLSLVAALVSWGATFYFSVPAHNRLAVGFDVEIHRALVQTNAIRLVSWTAHSAILLVMTARAMR